jgi:trafficking protein particle complex subunit 13
VPGRSHCSSRLIPGLAASLQVSNPLSVRTKAHAPNAFIATTSLSATERSKIFLEVQVQNQCEQAMWFERMRFEPVVGWKLEDVNEGLFVGPESLLPPAAVRQFVFVLSATAQVPIAPPGSSQGLGRLVGRLALGGAEL